MFSNKILRSDAFLDLPLTAQALYVQLNMEADDDGFVNNSKTIQRMIGASNDDLKRLVEDRFLIKFDSGVVCIKHWFMNNQKRKDRYTYTQYQEELQTLKIKENGAYTTNLNYNAEEELATKWQPNGNQMATQNKINKNKLNKNNNISIKNLTEEFEEVWRLYPKKQGKANALKAYTKARKNGTTKEQVEKGIKAYCEYIKKNKTEDRYIKHGSTFFNQECWNDTYGKTDNHGLTEDDYERLLAAKRK